VSLLPKTPYVYNYYAASDLFVCASFCEASPRVTLAAMAFGLPIVATNIYGIPEQLRDGIEALLIPPGDTDALTNAIVSLLCDSQKASRLVANARRRVETCFTEDRMVAAYESLLHEVCAA
jgi:glycosyltransferase involved in cell wall biosynthesis